ncbi:MAG: ECF transporter S component [Tissierellaceae bacterium]|nr:ECF transporter S component [Tissierellaceae bacterium]
MKKEKMLSVKRMASIGILGAISIVLGMTPLGFIPVGPTRATIMHIPVIIGAIVEGPIVGAIVGLIFGLFSVFQAITNPTPVSVVFLNPIVSIIPRVLIGLTSYYAYTAVKKIGNKKTILILNLIWVAILAYLSYGIYLNIMNSDSILMILMNIVLIVLVLIMGYFSTTRLNNKSLDIMIATIIGTLTNTVGVLSMIYFLHAEKFVAGLGLDISTARNTIFGLALTNGIPETIIAIIIVTSVVGALKSRERE